MRLFDDRDFSIIETVMLPSEWGQQSVRHDDDHKFKDEPGVPFTQCSLEIHPDDNAGTFAALQGSHSWSLTTLAFTSAGRKSRKVFVSNSSQNFSLPQGKEIRANASSTPSSSPSSSRVYESHHLDSCRYGENKGISSPLTGGLNNNMKKTRGRKMHINNTTSVKDHTNENQKHPFASMFCSFTWMSYFFLLMSCEVSWQFSRSQKIVHVSFASFVWSTQDLTQEATKMRKGNRDEINK